MRKSTISVLAITLLVLISSVVCVRGNNRPLVSGTPTTQEQVKLETQTIIQEQAAEGTKTNIQEQTTSEGQTNQVPEGISENNSGSGSMERVTVSKAESRNAVCNDGAPAVYYIRRGVGEGSTRWVIHLQGGGFCYSPETCNQREKEEPQFMTTKRTKKSRPGDGILSPSGKDNKFFATANQVFVAYCSSDLWSGDRAASTQTNGLHFRGVAIFRAVIEDLADPSITASPNLANATQVLLSGSSAGGTGVMVHLDWLAEQFPKAKVRGVNDAGWFIDIAPYSSEVTPVEKKAQLAFEYWNGSVDESCAAAKPGQEGLCYIGEYVYPYISTPLFVQIAQFDGPQLVDLGIKLPLDNADTEYAMKFGEAVRTSLKSVNAAFSPAKRTHGLLTNNKFQSVLIQGVSIKDVLGNWIFNLDGPIKVIDQP